MDNVIREETIAPAGYFAAELKKGQVLRIVDVQGQQVADRAGLVRVRAKRSFWPIDRTAGRARRR